MKILHTSDWHLGRQLYGRSRQQEFSLFLKWLKAFIIQERISILIISGDVFDTTTPSHYAQTLYYSFLSDLRDTECEYTVIISGNHDSSSFLNAPSSLLDSMGIWVQTSADISLEVRRLTLKSSESIVIGAVPYLRDQDIRLSQSYESMDDKQTSLINGIIKHYQEVILKAKELQANDLNVPILLTGHLFADGGVIKSDDGTRELYVGTLAHINVSQFLPEISYLALGHLHSKQSVGNLKNAYYSGTPLPMNFQEAKDKKEVLIYNTEKEHTQSIESFEVPIFQRLERIVGTKSEIMQRLSDLNELDESVWVEIEYADSEPIGKLSTDIEECLQNSKVEVIRILNTSSLIYGIKATKPLESLSELSPNDVFKRCLSVNNVPEMLQESLQLLFDEIQQSRLDEERTL